MARTVVGELSLGGMPVRVSPLLPEPKIKLTPKLAAMVSAECFRSFEAWSVKMFGTQEVCYVACGIMFVSRATYDSLKELGQKAGAL